MEPWIKELIDTMTLEEKASQMLHTSPGIERLGIPAYNWWNEAAHGVARAGLATIFPQVIGLGATFNPQLVQEVAEAIATEARAKFNATVTDEGSAQYRGLTFWAPNINIFRDPRWGRGQETFGEDPYLTALMGKAFVRGMQGDDPHFLKTAACAKHFAVHSGPEALRHEFDAQVSEQDLYNTYLPAFKALVDDGVEAVMGAYNRTLGEPCCGSPFLLVDLLRNRWNFSGHVVSDCWAVRDFHQHHKVTNTPEESVALAVNNGCDLNCGCTYEYVVKAVQQGLIDESKLDESVSRLLATRGKLGLLGPNREHPWQDLDNSVINCTEHRNLARKAATESIVLLKNKHQLLPLDDTPKKILLIGPTATNYMSYMGNYYGLSQSIVTLLEGMTEKVSQRPNIEMSYHPGCLMYQENLNKGWIHGMAEDADVVIAAFGIDSMIEGEEGDAIASKHKGDREQIELPSWQLEFLQQMKERGTPTVLVLSGGAPIAFPADIAESVLFTWYSGEEGGHAISDIIFGEASPSGKLPITFPRSTEQLPPYEDYTMQGRTYRFCQEAPLYPFGFGLSYTQFSLGIGKASEKTFVPGETLEITVDVINKGAVDGFETVQLYRSLPQESADYPQGTKGQALYDLIDFKKVFVPATETRRITFILQDISFSMYNNRGELVVPQGVHTLTIATCAPFQGTTPKSVANPISLSCKVVEA